MWHEQLDEPFRSIRQDPKTEPLSLAKLVLVRFQFRALKPAGCSGSTADFQKNARWYVSKFVIVPREVEGHESADRCPSLVTLILSHLFSDGRRYRVSSPLGAIVCRQLQEACYL